MVNQPSADSLKELSDEVLMDAVRRNNHAAFDQLMLRYQKPLLNFIRHLGVISDAEDVAQDAFVKLYRSRKRYRPTAAFKTYLYTIARRLCIDRFRQYSRRPKMEYDDELKKETDTTRGPDGIVADRLDLQKLLQKLPEAMREVVLLCVAEGFTMKETGRILNIPEGTVKSRLFNALRRMKKDLNGEGHE